MILIIKFKIFLQKYRVYSHSLVSLNKGSWIQVKVTFQRIYLYHLTNTYMPSACLVIWQNLTLKICFEIFCFWKYIFSLKVLIYKMILQFYFLRTFFIAVIQCWDYIVLQETRLGFSNRIGCDDYASHVHNVSEHFTNIAGHCLSEIYWHLVNVLLAGSFLCVCCSSVKQNWNASTDWTNR